MPLSRKEFEALEVGQFLTLKDGKWAQVYEVVGREDVGGERPIITLQKRQPGFIPEAGFPFPCAWSDELDSVVVTHQDLLCLCVSRLGNEMPTLRSRHSRFLSP